MIPRRASSQVASLLTHMPAVAIVGPRQAGKTTLALEIGGSRPSVYLDLESPADRARLSEPSLYFADHEDELVILDEIHRAPGLFEELRGVIDRGRREGKGTGRFLLLGSASIDLLAQSGESLAGRISYVELAPFDVSEVGAAKLDQLWIRGGFPESFLAASEQVSLRWRQDFLRTYLERDIPQLGPRIPAETLRRLWTMLAHRQGAPLNVAEMARGLGVSGTTAGHYIDLLVDLLLVRRLPPHLRNVGKRLVRSPKAYLRDSGILHALLGLIDKEAVLGHPIAGASWEGAAIESLILAAGPEAEASFYRTSHGAEIDLLLSWRNGVTWAVAVKRSLSPTVEKGTHSALSDLSPDAAFVVYPGPARYAISPSIEAISLAELCEEAEAVGGR